MIIHRKTVKTNNIQLDILSQMDGSVINFYETGSRFFGIADTDSDYDFFCVSVPNTEQELKRWGFTNLKSDTNVALYSDSNTAMVYEHTKAQIHVQIVKDVTKKRLAQELILITPMLFMELRSVRRKDKMEATKRNSRDFWNYVFSIVDHFFIAQEKVLSSYLAGSFCERFDSSTGSF